MVLAGPSSSPPFSGGPGKSPIMPGYLQVAGDVCKATPFFLFLSPALRPLVSSHSFSLNLASFPLFEDPKVFLFALSILAPEVLGLCKRFSERLRSLLLINCACFSWRDNQVLEALHLVPCFYKFSHLTEHLAECFHMEVIDGVQYSCTWSWVKINTLDIRLGVNSPFGTSPKALLIVLTTEHFLWCIYNQAIWDQERAYNFSRVRYRGRRRQWDPTPVLLPGKSHGRRSLVDCSPWCLEESDTTEQLHFHFSLSCTGEGNSNPLQCSCLENLQGWGSLVGCQLWGHRESDTTEAT